MWAVITAYVVAVVLLATVVATANQHELVTATVVTAPVGFVHILDRPIGQVRGVYAGGSFTEYLADTNDNPTIFYVGILENVLTTSGGVKIQPTVVENEYQAVAVDLPGNTDYVLLSRNGSVYLSRQTIIFASPEYVPREKLDDGDFVFVTTELDFTLRAPVTYVVPVTDPGTTITVVSDDSVRTATVNDLLGVQESCILFVSGRPQGFSWSGGLIPNPLCTENITSIVTDTYRGQALHTIFSTKVESYTIYFVFRAVDSGILQSIGFLTPVEKDPALHLVEVEIDDYIVYFSPGYTFAPVQIPVLEAVDTTVVVDDTYSCTLPDNASVLFYLGWRLPPYNESTNITLDPGETILFEEGDEVFLCMGDTRFLGPLNPSYSLPSIRELREPIGVRTRDIPALVMLGNGKKFYGTEITIEYSDYSGNTVWLVTASPITISVSPIAIYETPFFWLSLLLLVLFGALIIQRPKSPPKQISVVWNISPPPPLSLSSKQEIRERVSQFLDIYGYCPNDLELAQMGVLVPIGKESPTDEVILCPFKTNKRTEAILRKVIRLINTAFWVFRRRGRNYGYIYTYVGDSILVFYLYKQDSEKTPEELFMNAVRKALRTYIGIPLHTKYYGMIIIATKDMAEKVRRELRRFGVINEKGIVGDIGNYLSIKFSDMGETEKTKIVEFFQERIPLILVVDEELTKLIEVLGSISSKLYEEYLKRRGYS